MANNNNDVLKIIASLDVDQSAKQVKGDFEKVKSKVGQLKLPVDLDIKGTEKQIKELQKSLLKTSVDNDFAEPYKKAFQELTRLYELKERYAKLTVPSQETSKLFEQQIKEQEKLYNQSLPKRGTDDYSLQQVKQLNLEKISLENQLQQAIDKTTQARQKEIEVSNTSAQKSIQDLQKLEDKLITIQNKATSPDSGLLFGDSYKEMSESFNYIFSNISKLKDSLDIPQDAKNEIGKQIKAYEELYKTLQNVEKVKLEALEDRNNLAEEAELQKAKELKKEADALNKSLEEKRKLTERQNELLDKQGKIVEGLKIESNANLKDVQSSLSDHLGEDVTVKRLNDEYSKLGMTFRTFTAESSNADGTLNQLRGTIDQTTGEVRILSSETQQSVGITQKFGDSITDAAKQLFTFQQAFSVLKSFIKNSIDYLIDLDNSLNEIRIVTGKSAAEVEGLGKKYNQMARDMSVSTKEVAAASVEFYRQGLGDNKVVENLEAAITYSKIAKVELVQSAELITASMNSMGVSAERAIDVFSYLGDQTATGADEIGIAMQKTGGAAGALNIEFEKVASWIAVISSKTRESAETIGTSVNSILARLRQLKEKGYLELENGDTVNVSMVSKAFDKAGIELINSHTKEFNDFGQTIDALGAKWDLLDESTQAYISTVLAGTYQQSRFYALMEGYGESVELYNKALESNGVAQQKFLIWQESSAAALDKFKATSEHIAQNFISSDFIKDMINSGTKLMEVLAAMAGALNTPIGQGTIAFFLTGVNCHKMPRMYRNVHRTQCVYAGNA